MADFVPQATAAPNVANFTPALQQDIYNVQADPLKLQNMQLQNQGQQLQNQGQQTQNQVAQATAPLAIQNAKLDNAMKQTQAIYSGLAGVTDQDSWNNLLNWAQTQGIDTSRYPAQYDPGVVNKLQMGVLTAKDRLDMMYKQQQLQLDQQKTNADLLKAGVPPNQLPYGNPMTANGGGSPSASASAGGAGAPSQGAPGAAPAQQSFGFDQSNLANMNLQSLNDMKKEDSTYQAAEAARAQPLRNLQGDLTNLQTMIPQYQTGAGGGAQRYIDKGITAGATLLKNAGVPLDQLPTLPQLPTGGGLPSLSGVANNATLGDEINNTANRVVLGVQALQPTKGIRMTNAQLGIIKGGKPDINTETGANMDTIGVIKSDAADQQLYDALRAQYRANSPYGVADPQFDNFYNALVKQYPLTTTKDGKTSFNEGTASMLMQNVPNIIAHPSKFVPGWSPSGAPQSGSAPAPASAGAAPQIQNGTRATNGKDTIEYQNGKWVPVNGQ